jgi:hypothetical protein
MKKISNDSGLSKKKKWLKYLSVFSLVLIGLFTVLMVHIYMVTKPVNYDNNDLQLSRIDFVEEIDSLKANDIRHFVASLPGVENTMFNFEDNILVYGYLNGKQNSTTVFDQLMKHGSYKAKKFMLSEDLKTQGCPMAGKDRNSMVYRLTGYIYKLLN